MPTFAQIAGQLVPGGTGTNSPVANLEQAQTSGVATINGLMTKVSRTFIEETKVFGDPFGREDVVKKIGDEYGVGVEIAGFVSGAVNKKRTGACQPVGQVPLAAQVAYINWAYNIDVSLYDREINKAVLSPEEAGKYAAEKLKTPLKTIAQIHYRSWLQLMADPINGERVIASTTKSDGTGEVVSYNPTTIIGYAGMIGQPDIIIPAPVAGSLVSITDDDALLYAQTLEGVAADMAYESSAFSKLGVETFVSGKPLLFAETKVLNAFDNAFSLNAGYKGFPTVSARQFMSRFADIVEIDAFPALPTNATYATKRLAGVLIDRDALREIIKYADVESDRCVTERATGYNYQGESIMSIYRGAPSYALLAKVA